MNFEMPKTTPETPDGNKFEEITPEEMDEYKLLDLFFGSRRPKQLLMTSPESKEKLATLDKTLTPESEDPESLRRISEEKARLRNRYEELSKKLNK